MKRFSILILTLCLCLTGCGKQTTEATAQIFAMDTVMEVADYGEHAEQAVKYTEKRIEELENRLSRTKAHSLVSGLAESGRQHPALDLRLLESHRPCEGVSGRHKRRV